jgi:hypothetical protein
MSTSAGPNIVEDGLVLYLDATNEKSYPYHPDTMDHGISDWYCFLNATITYSIIYPDTIIYQKDTSGNITEVLSASTPQRGTFSGIAGYKYWGSKGIFLSDEGQQHYVVPMTAAGESFMWYASRNVSPGQIYVYSPFANATVNYFNGTTNGINDTPTTTITVNKGTQSTSLQYINAGYHYISSDYPIIASIGGSADIDNTPLNPAEDVVYNRYDGYIRTVINTAPTNAAYAFYDSNPTMSHTIGDGAGGNCAQGLGKSYISDRYSFGNALSDYTIVCPNDNFITTSYWNGSQWIVWDTHDLSGTELSPVRVTRDGTNGAGVEASSIAGPSTNMASGATLWKWEGVDRFFVGINDTADDEMSLYGWMSNNYERKASNEDLVWYDISGNSNNGQIFGDFTFNRSTKVFHSNGVTGSYIDIPSPNLTSSDFTVISATRYAGSSPRGRIVSAKSNNWLMGHWDGNANKYYSAGWVSTYTQADEEWRIFAGTGNISSDQYSFFSNKNKLVTNSAGGSAGPNGFSIGRYGPGNSEYSNCDVGFLAVYNRVLSDSEIQQIFNALRSRYEL